MTSPAAAWITESDEPEPTGFREADDRLRAADALRHLDAGGAWWWRGDWHNGRQLLTALERRLDRRAGPLRGDLATRWRAQRAHTATVAETLGRVVVALDADGRLDLPRAPDTREAVALAWPDRIGAPARVGLRTLVGALGAAGWTRAGVAVPGLEGRLIPRFGVFSPTRAAYVTLLASLPDVAGRTVLDVGCGTGVLGFVLLQRGAARVVATDLDPRAVACARDNAAALGLADRWEAREGDLFAGAPPAELVVFNPPWLPEAPRTRLDRAIFDPDGQVFARFLTALPGHVRPGGRAALLLSDLPERLGLRAEGAVDAAIAAAGLRLVARHDSPATHGRARDTTDPLAEARSKEAISLRIVARDPA